MLGKRFLPNSLNPDNNKKLSYQSGLIENATRTPKNYKFMKALIFNEAIIFDNILNNYQEKYPPSFRIR